VSFLLAAAIALLKLLLPGYTLVTVANENKGDKNKTHNTLHRNSFFISLF